MEPFFFFSFECSSKISIHAGYIIAEIEIIPKNGSPLTCYKCQAQCLMHDVSQWEENYLCKLTLPAGY